eukprot:220089-Amphidinium_carterae.1
MTLVFFLGWDCMGGGLAHTGKELSSQTFLTFLSDSPLFIILGLCGSGCGAVESALQELCEALKAPGPK